MVSRRQANEVYRLQSEIGNEIARDAPEIATMVFGGAKDQPDVVSVSNERLDDVYRQAYLREDRAWLQAEARRDPEQFEKITDRIGVVMPQAPPGRQVPPPTTGAFAKTAAALPAPPVAPAGVPPSAGPVPPIAPPLLAPQPPPPIATPPVILGPNGQPLPPSGVV